MWGLRKSFFFGWRFAVVKSAVGADVQVLAVAPGMLQRLEQHDHLMEMTIRLHWLTRLEHELAGGNAAPSASLRGAVCQHRTTFPRASALRCVVGVAIDEPAARRQDLGLTQQ